VLAQVFYGTSLNNVNPTWLSSSDHCSWSGVTCNAEQKVTSLDLEDLGLTGAYPSTLNNLSVLTTLTTEGNNLTGSISNDICSIRDIQILANPANCVIEGCCL
jgi:hypothetical protein